MNYVYIFVIILFINGNIQGQNQDFFDAQPELENWVKERIENAKDGMHEMVQLPFVVRTEAWGCRCPNHYIGVSVDTHEGPWIMPITPKGFPISDDIGYSLVVTGYFTGKQITKDYRESDKEPKSWIYTMAEFKILSWKKNEKGYDVGGPKVLKS